MLLQLFHLIFKINQIYNPHAVSSSNQTCSMGLFSSAYPQANSEHSLPDIQHDIGISPISRPMAAWSKPPPCPNISHPKISGRQNFKAWHYTFGATNYLTLIFDALQSI